MVEKAWISKWAILGGFWPSVLHRWAEHNIHVPIAYPIYGVICHVIPFHSPCLDIIAYATTMNLPYSHSLREEWRQFAVSLWHQKSIVWPANFLKQDPIETRLPKWRPWHQSGHCWSACSENRCTSSSYRNKDGRRLVWIRSCIRDWCSSAYLGWKNRFERSVARLKTKKSSTNFS